MNRLLTFAFLIIVASPAFAEEAPADSVTVLDDVVVTESRYDQTTRVNVSNITNEELQLREPDRSLPMLLDGLPGVFSYSDAGNGLGYTYLKIRGFDQRRVGVLFNGIPMNDPEDHQVWWVNLADLAASVQDIQVQRGVTNSVGGMTAIGGTVNIIARDLAKKPRGKASLNLGSYGFSRQMMEYQTGDLGGGLSMSFRLSHQESDGYRDRSGYEAWGGFWSVQHQSDKSTTRLNIYTGREVTHHAWDAVPESILKENRTANMETYHNAIDNFSQPHYEAHNTYFFNDTWSMTNRLYYIEGEGYYENFKEDRRAADYALDFLEGVDPDDRLDLIRQKWVRKKHLGWVPSVNWEQGAGRMLIGGDLYTFSSDHWGDVLWAEGYAPGDFLPEYKYHQYTGDKDAWSAYVNQRLDVTDGLIITADLHFQHKKYRFEQNEVGNFTGSDRHAYTVDYDFFNPKGSINWQVPGSLAGGTMAMYGTAGINHREPTDNELFNTWESGSDLGAQPMFRTRDEVLKNDGTVDWVEWSNPYVQPERVVDYELGLGWQSRSVSVTLGGYWMDFQDEIVSYGGVNEDGSSIRGNAEETRHKGIELGLRGRINASNDLTLAASRSWDEFVTFNQYLDTDWDGTADTIVDNSGNPISHFPEHLLMVGWETRWNQGIRSRIRVRNTGKQYLDNTGDEERTIDSWTTLDVSLWFDLGGLGWRAMEGGSVFVHARNLGDTEYETWGYYGWNEIGQQEENFYTPAAGMNFAVGLDYDF